MNKVHIGDLARGYVLIWAISGLEKEALKRLARGYIAWDYDLPRFKGVDAFRYSEHEAVSFLRVQLAQTFPLDVPPRLRKRDEPHHDGAYASIYPRRSICYGDIEDPGTVFYRAELIMMAIAGKQRKIIKNLENWSMIWKTLRDQHQTGEIVLIVARNKTEAEELLIELKDIYTENNNVCLIGLGKKRIDRTQEAQMLASEYDTKVVLVTDKVGELEPTWTILPRLGLRLKIPLSGSVLAGWEGEIITTRKQTTLKNITRLMGIVSPDKAVAVEAIRNSKDWRTAAEQIVLEHLVQHFV